ncbi:Histidyl-tRNA synthetase [hydrothermal vent metagenome]|uniref:histidine--tRNA ligase n=1 Tax=hydrothermal vent metagenome TaxID=652676 RepID=A0A3B1D7H6_9ZZZZ
MKYRAIKGVQDILPPDVYLWQEVESIAAQVFAPFGYREIRTPVMEFTEVFTRSIGETTDIVEKEMYTFNDRAGRSITLRPEGTAPVVRAYVENHLYSLPSPQKYYYIGPMFRYERPQKGRFRQFHQIGVEAFGEEDPRMDAEVLDMLRCFLERVGMDNLRFEINSIGCDECRPLYRKALVDFLTGRIDSLCPDCRRRYEVNPLRVLDCKVKGCEEIKKKAPGITDYLCSGCREHFDALLGYLELLKIPFSVNPAMVRGLDYYTRTTFEVTSESLGAQSAVAAGGRYDKLIEEFGGPAVPGIGFAIGMERLTSLIKDRHGIVEPVPVVYFAAIGDEAEKAAYKLASEMRTKGIWVELDYSGASLKSRFRKADRLKATYVFILGEDELSRGTIRYKRLSDGEQGEINKDDVMQFFG